MNSLNLDNRETQDDDPLSQIRPRCVPEWLLWTLSVLAILLSLLSLAGALVLWYRGFRHNKPGIIAAGLIGIVLVSAGILGIRLSMKQSRQPELFKTERSLKSNPVLRITAFIISLPAVIGTIAFLWEGVILLNQEHLHWVKVNSYRSFGETSISTMMWSDFIAGEICLLTTIFLWWFAFFKGRSRSTLLTNDFQSQVTEKESVSSDSIDPQHSSE